MKIYEIKNFALGYDDSVTSEMAPENTTQDSSYVDYATEIGALQKDTGERNIGASTITAAGATYGTGIYGVSVYGESSTSTEFYPLSGVVQRIYEGNIDVSGSGVFNNKRLCFADGKAYHYCAGEQFIPLAYGSAIFSDEASAIPDVTHYNNTFYATGGYDYDIREWNGLALSMSTVSGLGSWNASVSLYLYRANTVEAFQDRLWLGNMKESEDNGTTWTVSEQRVRYSSAGDPNIWDTTSPGYVNSDDPSYIDIVDKAGDEIVKLFAYGDVLLVFKKNSLHKITYTGGNFAYEPSAIDRSTINNAPWSVAAIPNGCIFLNEEGLQITDGNTVQQFPADKKVTQLLKRIYTDSIRLCFGIANDSLNEYWLSIPVDGSSTCNRIIVYNWKHDTWRIRLTDTTCLGLYTKESSGTWFGIKDYFGYELIAMKWSSSKLYPGSNRIIIGRSDGYVRERAMAFNIVGSGYDSYHITPWMDFDTPGDYKEVVRIQPLWEGTAGDTVTVSVRSDSDASWTSLTSDDFAVTGIAEQPYLFMRKTGRKFRFKFYNGNANENYRIYRMKIFYEQRAGR